MKRVGDNLERKYKSLMTMNIILVILVLALGVYVLKSNGVFDKDVGLSPLDSTKILAYGTQNGSFTGAILNTIGTGKTLLCLTSGLSQNCLEKSGGDFVFSTGGGTSYKELARIDSKGVLSIIDVKAKNIVLDNRYTNEPSNDLWLDPSRLAILSQKSTINQKTMVLDARSIMFASGIDTINSIERVSLSVSGLEMYDSQLRKFVLCKPVGGVFTCS